MSTPGVRNIGIGLAWLAGGTLVTIFTAAAARPGGGIFVVAWGAMLIGLGQFLLGLIQYTTRTRSLVDKPLAGTSNETKALVRAGVAAAQCDRPLDAARIAQVQSLLKEADGNDYSTEQIEKVAAASVLDKRDTYAYLKSLERDLTFAQMKVIVRVCAILLLSPGPLSVKGQEFLARVRNALNLPGEQFLEAIADLPIVFTGISDAAERQTLAAAYIERAVAHFKAQAYAAMQADSEHALALDPQAARAYVFRGMSRYFAGNFEGATADYSQAIRLDPANPGAYINRAWSYGHTNQPKEALADAEHVIKIRPQDPEGFNVRGWLREALGQREQAIADYRAALARNPKHANATNALRRLGVNP
jgi:tetratricopeptide (TPR) repeat protein